VGWCGSFPRAEGAVEGIRIFITQQKGYLGDLYVRELKQLCVVSNERTVKISGVEHEGITTCPELHRTFEESTG
jgi:hypothetical protein